jgi:cysteine/glycine-rich protein
LEKEGNNNNQKKTKKKKDKTKKMSFTGTLDKCNVCDKTVYVVDMLSIEGMPYHKSCFRCTHCKGTLQMSNYSSMDGVLYCKTHFEQLFKESGNFSKNFQPGKTEKPELVGSSLHVLVYD